MGRVLADRPGEYSWTTPVPHPGGERQARGLTWNPKQMVGMALKTAVQVEGLVGDKYPLVSPVPPVPPTQHPGGG